MRESSQNRSCRRRRNPARTAATRMRIRKLVPSRRCAVLPLTSTDVAGEVVMSPMLLRAPFFRRSLSFTFASSSLAFFHLTRSFQHSNATPFSFSFPPALSSSSSLEVCMCSFSLFRLSFPRSPPFASSTRNDLSRAERALNRHLKSAPTPSLSHSECGFISTRYARARESTFDESTSVDGVTTSVRVAFARPGRWRICIPHLRVSEIPRYALTR